MQKYIPFLFILLFSISSFSQKKLSSKMVKESTLIKKDTSVTIDIKKKALAFLDENESKIIDSLWMNSIYNSPLYDTLSYVIPDKELKSVTYKNLTTAKLKEQLKELDSKTPFNVAYNPVLEKVIKNYLKTRKKTLSRLLGKAQFYFPIFEQQLDKYDIPLEMKYLAIVESALRPAAKSRVGATGLWQFMYGTGKQFGLKVSSYVDDRTDPLKSTEAACKYLAALYKIFGDWDLVLAAYNSGPGNVNKAIRRSGGYRNYWNIRPYLPYETQGYVPAFYATLYIFEYHKEFNIKPIKPKITYFETDTVRIKHTITFDQVVKNLKIDYSLLEFLNPEYKLDIIPYVKGKHYTITLPKQYAGKFVKNEKQIYALALKENQAREKPLPRYFELNNRIRYRVRNGDYLGKIARRYGVGVSKIKRWNGLRSTRLRIGQHLYIYPRKFASARRYHHKPKTIHKKYNIYIVRKGDSLWSISRKYPKISMEQLKKWNGIWSAKHLKPGTKLKIYKI